MVLESNLVPSASTSESKEFYLKMKGDYHRYMEEFKVGDERKEAAEDTMNSYKAAQVRRLRIQQRIKNAELGILNEEPEIELPNFPSLIPFLPHLVEDVMGSLLKEYLNLPQKQDEIPNSSDTNDEEVTTSDATDPEESSGVELKTSEGASECSRNGGQESHVQQSCTSEKVAFHVILKA